MGKNRLPNVAEKNVEASCLGRSGLTVQLQLLQLRHHCDMARPTSKNERWGLDAKPILEATSHFDRRLAQQTKRKSWRNGLKSDFYRLISRFFKALVDSESVCCLHFQGSEAFMFVKDTRPWHLPSPQTREGEFITWFLHTISQQKFRRATQLKTADFECSSSFYRCHPPPQKVGGTDSQVAPTVKKWVAPLELFLLESLGREIALQVRYCLLHRQLSLLLVCLYRFLCQRGARQRKS